MPNVAALARRGVQAESLLPEDPALPVPGYLAMSTGRRSGQSGLPTSQGPGSAGGSTDGTLTPEPVWRTAMRSGLRTATVFWPAATLDDPQMYAEYMVVTAVSDVPSAQHTLALTEAVDWEGAPSSFSPPREAMLSLTAAQGCTTASFYLLTLDTEDDAESTYQRVLLDDDKNLTNGYSQILLGQWASITISPRLHSGVRICFTASTGATVTLYSSQAIYSRARPGELLQDINRRFGVPPPPPDAAALRAGWLTPEQYVDMALLRHQWISEVMLHVYQAYSPELLLTSWPLIADFSRVFLLVDGRQEGYGPEKAEIYATYLKQAHSILDQSLGRLLSQVNLAHSSVFVVSPNGSLPVHTAVNVNTILTTAKLLSVKAGSPWPATLDTSKSKAWASTNQGIAHVYINLQGRESTGIVPPEDYAKVQEQIIKAMVDAKDETGQQVFARVLRREDLAALHLDTPDAGDVFAQAAPGYLLGDALNVKKALSAAPCCAAEGLPAELPEMHGVFVAAGGLLASNKTVPSVSILDLAPTIARALRFQPVADTDGHALEGIWR